ncbi:MAG: ABC transporter permease [Pseudomonadota bacterium]
MTTQRRHQPGKLQHLLLLVSAVAGLLLLYSPVATSALSKSQALPLSLFAACALLITATWFLWPNVLRGRSLTAGVLSAVVSFGGAWYLIALLADTQVATGFWAGVVAAWALGWFAVEQLAAVDTRRAALVWLLRILIPVAFGAWLLIIWEVVTRGLSVPQVLLPSPSAIAARFASSRAILWADFQQTFLKAVLIGYVMGCGSGFIVALLIDRSDFLKRGLLPIGNLVSALPVVGIAPIMVMWFGFDWPSKAAVVVVMTFFPMLVNTVAGLAASDSMQRDLMKTYAAGYWQSLFKLRLPLALPFIFNALKINSTLALIGAIVAEFFGTPIVGMGFRISTEVGRMNVDMVWAEIAVAAVAGSLFYGLIGLVERMLTFWHPSFRR